MPVLSLIAKCLKIPMSKVSAAKGCVCRFARVSKGESSGQGESPRVIVELSLTAATRPDSQAESLSSDRQSIGKRAGGTDAVADTGIITVRGAVELHVRAIRWRKTQSPTIPILRAGCGEARLLEEWQVVDPAKFSICR